VTAPSLTLLRDAVIAGLAAGLPGVKSVAPHGGDVTEDLLRRYGQDAPCLRVACAGVGATYRHGSGLLCLPAHMAVIVVTKDAASVGAGRTGRDQAALALAGAVTLVIDGNRWGLDDTRQPEHLQAKNEFSGDIDKLGLAAWQVTWTQDVLLGRTDDMSAAIAALSALWINGAPFAANGEDPAADPVKTAPRAGVLGDPLGGASPPVVFAPAGPTPAGPTS
jgi:hypothetical protein